MDEDERKMSGGATTPVTLEFRNVAYTVVNKTRHCPFTSGENSTILNGVSGAFYPGTLTAIMGPSGAGKTSLLDILAGYRRTNVTGQVLINGIQRSERVPLRHLQSYILQEDHLLPHITVAEAMTAAATLKLGSTLTSQQRAVKVNNILEKMGLQSCCLTMCSRISGGQRKRLSIALELLNNPPVMFFDEPTSGLDSSSCLSCIGVLRSLARQGHTVICTVHQPSSRIFAQFDQLYVLAEGGCIYRGARYQLIDYLTAAGLRCPDYHNPADFVIEVASGEYGSWTETLRHTTLNGKSSRYIQPKSMNSELKSPDVCVSSETASSSMVKLNPSCPETSSHAVLMEPIEIGGSPESPRAQSMSALLLAKNVPTVENAGVLSDLGHDCTPQLDEDSLAPGISLKSEFATSTWFQFNVLLARTMRTILRNKMVTSVRLISYVVFGILMGAVYHDIGNRAERIYNNSAHLFFDLMFIVFSSLMPTILTFPLEMSVFTNEHRNGWYSVKAYYLAKTVADLPFQMLLPLVYNAIVYTMTGQPLEWIRFGQFSLVMALAALIAQSTGLLIGASCSIQTAVFLGPVTMMPAILFCGFFVDHQQLPVWLGWISRLSFTRYGFEALVLSVLGHGRSPLKCSQPYCHYRRPRKFLQELSLSESGYWVDVGVLVLIAVLLRCIGYLVLRWKVTRKR